MSDQAEHEAAARRAFYTGKGLAAGDMNEQHIIDAFAADRAEAVRVAVEKERERCRSCGHSMADNAHGFDQSEGYLCDVHGEGGDHIVHAGHCIYCKVCRAGAEGDATPGPEPLRHAATCRSWLLDLPYGNPLPCNCTPEAMTPQPPPSDSEER